MHMLLVLCNDDVVKAYSVPQTLVSPENMATLRGLVQEKVRKANKGVRFDDDKIRVRLQHIDCDTLSVNGDAGRVHTSEQLADDIFSYVE